MLSPSDEFPHPELLYDRCSFNTNEENAVFLKKVQHHYFNSKVMLQIPGVSSRPKLLNEVLENDTQSYLIKELPLHELCTHEFIQTFVKYGKIYALSINTHLDLDDCMAFTPDGKLHLSLTQDSYVSLGLDGKLSSHILRTPKIRYVVMIDTQQPGFHPSKNLYKNTHKKLSCHKLVFDVQLNWVPTNEKLDPSAIAKYFHDKGYEVEETPVSHNQHALNDVKIPRHIEEEHLDWLGFCALASTGNKDLNWIEFSSEAMENKTMMNVSNFTGLISPGTILSLYEKLRKWLLDQNLEEVPWCAVTVYGNPDSPISWGSTENCYRLNGENFYTIILSHEKSSIFTFEVSKKPDRFYLKTSNKH